MLVIGAMLMAPGVLEVQAAALRPRVTQQSSRPANQEIATRPMPGALSRLTLRAMK